MRCPDIPVSLSSEVSPEMREWERFSTTVANAYVQPMMARYLRRLEADLHEAGAAAPLFLMMSGGGLTTIETACRFPIRLVESGPAGGAIFSAHIARECGLDSVLSFDMGGTTAKICLIDDYQAANRPHLRSRPGRPFPQRIGPATADSGDRDGRDRRRRRLDRACRYDGTHRGRTGKRRRRSGTRVLRPWWHPSGRDRCQSVAWPLRSSPFRRRLDEAGRRRRARCAARRCRRRRWR